jgi:membrane fusion protein (multidrug efflux system)
MNPIIFVKRRPITGLMLVVTLASGVLVGVSEMGVRIFPPPVARQIHVRLASVGPTTRQAKQYVVGRLQSYFRKREEQAHEEPRKVLVTSPKTMDVVISQPYVCQIHSRRHIQVCALDSGYLEQINVQEGQAVKEGDLMFAIKPVLYEAKYKAEQAEATLALREFQNTEYLFKRPNPVVSDKEVLLYEARKDRAKSKAELAKAELDFTKVLAPFDGIVDRQERQLGSLIKEGETLTTLSDNSVMWVYFNVIEAEYLEYKASLKDDKRSQEIELELANHAIFVGDNKRPVHPTRVTVEGQFNNQTGTIPFRADFPNPGGLLRHGQTGTVWIRRKFHDSIVIPQRATFDILDKRYVWVVGEDDKAHQRLITIKHTLEDIFVIDSGVDIKDKIVLEGVREVEEGGKVEYEFRKPEEALKNQKFHAE